MELKHLRKGKIQKIKTDVLDSELKRLEDRQLKHEMDIADNETYYKVLEDRIKDKEGLGTWQHPTRDKVWSDDKEEWYKLKILVDGAYHSINKMKEKKRLIELELTDRILAGY